VAFEPVHSDEQKEELPLRGLLSTWVGHCPCTGNDGGLSFQTKLRLLKVSDGCEENASVPVQSPEPVGLALKEVLLERLKIYTPFTLYIKPLLFIKHS
jgi:hypothetical protein